MALCGWQLISLPVRLFCTPALHGAKLAPRAPPRLPFFRSHARWRDREVQWLASQLQLMAIIKRLRFIIKGLEKKILNERECIVQRLSWSFACRVVFISRKQRLIQNTWTREISHEYYYYRRSAKMRRGIYFKAHYFYIDVISKNFSPQGELNGNRLLSAFVIVCLFAKHK